MLNNTTIEGLKTLRLPAMAEGLPNSESSPTTRASPSRSASDCSSTGNSRTPEPPAPARLEDGEAEHSRRGRRPRLHEAARTRQDRDPSLAESHWVEEHQVVVIVGPTGVGKTYLACALANAAIRHGHSALYMHAPRMFDELAIARADGRLARLMAAWARDKILVIDDFLLRPLNDDQAADLLEVIEDRAELRSTIVTCQLPIANWHEALGDATIADAVMDRLLERAHRIELSGDWMRRNQMASDQQEGEAGIISTP